MKILNLYAAEQIADRAKKAVYALKHPLPFHNTGTFSLFTHANKTILGDCPHPFPLFLITDSAFNTYLKKFYIKKCQQPIV